MKAVEDLSVDEWQQLQELETELREYRDSEGVTKRYRTKLTAMMTELEMAKNSADRIGLVETVTKIANRL